MDSFYIWGMETTLKVSELRIGNRIHYESNEITVIEINGIRNRVSCIWVDDEYIADYPIETLKPIPLTEDWLVRFGIINGEWFKNSSYKITYSYGLDGCYDFIHRNANHNIEMCITFIKHVHQLQNIAFALTGEELILDSKKD